MHADSDAQGLTVHRGRTRVCGWRGARLLLGRRRRGLQRQGEAAPSGTARCGAAACRARKQLCCGQVDPVGWVTASSYATWARARQGQPHRHRQQAGRCALPAAAGTTAAQSRPAAHAALRPCCPLQGYSGKGRISWIQLGTRACGEHARGSQLEPHSMPICTAAQRCSSAAPTAAQQPTSCCDACAIVITDEQPALHRLHQWRWGRRKGLQTAISEHQAVLQQLVQ